MVILNYITGPCTEVFISVPSGHGATLALYEVNENGTAETAFFFVERALTAVLAAAVEQDRESGELRENPDLASFGKLPLHLLALVRETPILINSLGRNCPICPPKQVVVVSKTRRSRPLPPSSKDYIVTQFPFISR